MHTRSIKHMMVLGLASAAVALSGVPVLADTGDEFTAGVDEMGSVMTHRVEIFDLPGLPFPFGLYDVNVEGPTTVRRDPPAMGGGGLHVIPTEIEAMDLVGTLDKVDGPGSFAVAVNESPTRLSEGLVREQVPSAFPGHFDADSFFDVFIEIEILGLTVFNKNAAYVLAEDITWLPPEFPTDYPVRGWLDEGSPVEFVDLQNPPLWFHDLPAPLYIADPGGTGPDIHVGYLLDGNHTVPEPASVALLALGGLLAMRRRR